MRPQKILINQVKSFLQEQHNIKISIPTLKNLLDSKVNLKIIPSTINSYTFQSNHHSIDYTHENRYKLIIFYIQSLLSSSSLDLPAIEAFMGVLNRTIDTDIDIMQKNQVVRSNSFKMKEKLHFRIDEISRKTQILKATSQKIYDKAEIINFIAIDIKNFLQSMKLIQNQYEAVKTVEIHTPLKIDKIYQYESSSQQDYHDHYEPLLEVLVRMKANMGNLQQAVRNSERIEVPIKSVNLLATCKNLLTELQPFLITSQCSYNRLIFHVVTQQSENMKLISSFYKYHLDFVKSLVYNAFKCVYLGHLFEGYYKQIAECIQRQKKCITEMIIRITMNKKQKQYLQIEKNLKNYQQNLQKIGQKIRNMREIICFGKTSLLHVYLEEKICKKLSYLLSKQQQLNKLFNLIRNSRKYITQVKKLNTEETQISKLKQQVDKHAKIIGKDLTLSQKAQLISEGSHQQKKRQKLFKDDFLKIQQANVRVSGIHQNFIIFQNDSDEKKIRQEYFPFMYQAMSNLKQQLSEMELKLLKSYQTLLEIDQQKQIEAQELCSKITRQINDYLTNENKLDGSTYTAMGGQILNQDDQCNQIKILLGKIDKAQFSIKNSIKKKNSNPEEKMKKFEMYRKFLEWLLTLFESSMDENILQNIVDKMDFKQEDEVKIQKNVGKVNQLLSQIQKHNRQVIKIIKQIQLRNVKESQKLKKRQKSNKMLKQEELSQEDLKNKQLELQNSIYNKIFIIARDRLILYQFIQMMYGEYLSVYLQLKFNPNAKTKTKKVELYQFQSKGIKLFDQKIFQHALLYYHCHNKISMVTKQLNDSNIASKTKNYLNDQISDPYIGRLNAFLKYNEAEMLNLALRLQKSIKIEKNYKGQIKKWEETVLKGQLKDESVNKYIERIKQQSEQLQQMGIAIEKILQLDKQRFVVHNMQQMRKIFKQCEQYILVATQVKNSQNMEQIGQNIQLKNQKLAQIIKAINKNCQQK